MSDSLKLKDSFDIQSYLSDFAYDAGSGYPAQKTRIEFYASASGLQVPKFINEFWTSRQRQANSIHEISYRACFKPQLPAFFIELLTQPGDLVYDPFSGRGTTIIEAALRERKIIANDINPLSEILCKARLFVPTYDEVDKRLKSIPVNNKISSDTDISMFYQTETLKEILSLREYLYEKYAAGNSDHVDNWIRMIATNRLTGHSNGFFSVYTLPPNQAVSALNQIRINKKRDQKPEYRNTKELILKKTKALLRDVNDSRKLLLHKAGNTSRFLTMDARTTSVIDDGYVKLTVTSPPFLDVVQYKEDNWLRCWFNKIDADETGGNISITKTIEEWNGVMLDVFRELNRITIKNGYVAFEVGEVKNGRLNLDEHVVDISTSAGFVCEGIMINRQSFTKTANIWGISNNKKGTNSNRIVILRKP